MRRGHEDAPDVLRRFAHAAAALVLLLVAGSAGPTASPATPSSVPFPRLCDGLQEDVGVVSPRGREAKILRRIDTIVRAETGKAPEIRQVIEVYADCLDILRERLREPRDGADDPDEDSATSDEDRRALAELARLELRTTPEGGWRGRVAPRPRPTSGTPAETVPADMRTDATAIVADAPPASDLELDLSGALPAAAERITRSAQGALGAGSRDRAVRNALWFLWIESYMKALGRFNHYVYSDERLVSDAIDMGKAFAVGFRPKFEEDGRLRVAEVTDERLGTQDLHEGDEVLSLDGRPVARIEEARLWRYWLSPDPFRFEMEVRRGDRTHRARGESVPRRFATMDWSVQGTKAYLRIRRFAAQSLIEMRRALREIEKAGATGLVIDLRHDGGGVISPGLVDCFIRPGAKIITFEEMASGAEPQHIEATVEYHGLPLVVLVDAQTASMGEAFAAAIQVNGRGRLIGQTTFGKGVGQSKHLVEDEGTLWLVDRVYFYPGTRRTWNGTGIQPDIPVDVGKDELHRVEEMLEAPVIDLARQWPDDSALRKAFETLESKP